jgi:xanthine dehydrogenase YagR molybdenum-binding subunit
MLSSPFADVKIEDVEFANGLLFLKTDPKVFLSIKDIMNRSGKKSIRETSTALPMLKQKDFSRKTHAAAFAEVQVDEKLGSVKVKKVVSAIAAGRIINPKTAGSQVLGSIVWGISQALMEDSIMDNNYGRFINHNYEGYPIPVNLDVNDIEVIFVEEKDEIVNPLGVKGVGEIGQVGVAAAVANAIFNATGKRIRSFPITLDKLMS